MILCVLFLVVCVTYTAAVSTTDIIANTSLPQLTSAPAHALPNSSAGEDELWVWYCANTERWTLPKLQHDDCLGMLDYFFIETADETSHKAKEFRMPGAKRKAHVRAQTTPRKYTFGRACLSKIFYHSKCFSTLISPRNRHGYNCPSNDVEEASVCG